MVIADIFKGVMFKSNGYEWVVLELVAARNRMTQQWETYVRLCLADDCNNPGRETFELPLYMVAQMMENHRKANQHG
jgi:hypothetical protein